jgi:hypothetical protein
LIKPFLRVVTAALMLAGCTADSGEGASQSARAQDSVVRSALDREVARIRAVADSVDAIFQPLPLLRPADEAALQRHGNDAQLARARMFGISPNTNEAQLEDLVRAGRLVRLADSTDLWVVRKLDHSAPYVTPAAEMLLRELAGRFHEALGDLHAPRFRLEITSALRTAQNQEQLRLVNPNAARGPSTHQYGTTFDVAYNAFAAPARPLVKPTIAEAEWLGEHLETFSATTLEIVGARRSRELMAILGKVLIAMQNEGKVMVTLERLQPVYHMTATRSND